MCSTNFHITILVIRTGTIVIKFCINTQPKIQSKINDQEMVQLEPESCPQNLEQKKLELQIGRPQRAHAVNHVNIVSQKLLTQLDINRTS